MRKHTAALLRRARPLLAIPVGLLGIALIVASGGGGGDGGGGTDAEGNPTSAGAPTWFKSFGGAGDDAAYGAIPTSDGGYAFTGVLGDRGAGGDLWLAKLDSFGDLQWQRAFGERLLLQDDLWSLISTSLRPAQGPDGALWFLGSGRLDAAAGHTDLVVAKLDASGNPAWAKSFDSGAYPGFAFFDPTSEVAEFPQSVTPTADGGALVASWNYATIAVPGGSGASERRDVRYLWLVKLSSTGFAQWTRRITDDQLMYEHVGAVSSDDADEVRVRELADGSLLVTIVTRLLDSACSACASRSFASTRVVHLRSGGESIVNARIPYRFVGLSIGLEAVPDFTHRALPAAVPIDADDDGVPERYLLAGWGLDVGAPLHLDNSAHEALVVDLAADGIVDDEQFFDHWPEGTRLTVIEPSCPPGTPGSECRYLIAGSAPAGQDCGRTPVLAEIDLGLGLTRDFNLQADTGPQSCINMTPTNLDVMHAQPSELVLRGFTNDPSDPRTVFSRISALLPPPGDATITATRVTTSLDAFAQTASFTPDDQILAIALPAGPESDPILTRITFAGDVTLTEPLRVAAGDRAVQDAGLSVAEAPDQGLLVVGESSFGANRTPTVWALKTDRDGNIVWQRRLPRLSIADGNRPSVLASADGGVLFGARTVTDAAAVLVKLDNRGDLVWKLRLPTQRCSECDIRLATLPGGDVVAVGSGMTGEVDTYAWLARVTAAGALVWLRTYAWDFRSFDDVDVTADGNVLVTGRDNERPATWSFTSDGEPRWWRRYSIEGLLTGLALTPIRPHGANRAEALADGGFLMAFPVVQGTAYSDQNVLLLRADATGVAQWERLLGAGGNELLHELRALRDGGALLAGVADSLGEGAEAWVARLGADGRVSTACNAGLADYSLRLDTQYDVSLWRVPPTQVAAAPEVDATPVATHGGEFLPSASEVVVARQCSGTAAPENPGPAPARFTLTVASDAPLPGAITSSPPGISCGTALNACTAQFDAGTFVLLLTDPAITARLEQWDGCDNADHDFCTVRMSADKTIRVAFRAGGPALLSITSITGDGGVRDGGVLDCRSSAAGPQGTCSASYAFGDSITLLAVPGAGQSVLGWTGPCVSGADPTRAVVVMNGAKSCGIAFSGVPADSPLLQVVPEALDAGGPVDPAPLGRIRSEIPGIDCGTDCSERVPLDSTVVLTASVESAAAAAGWEFEHFVCAGVPATQLDARSVTLHMTADLTCTARFRNTIKRLYLDIANDGGSNSLGRVVSEPTRLDCTADCDVSFATGEAVILRARPLASATLRSWQGCDTTGSDPNPGAPPPLQGQPIPDVCYVTMNQTRNVAAFFELINIGSDGDFTLTVAFTGPGSPPPGGFVDSTPSGISCSTEGGTCAHSFPRGSVVRLVAGAYPGSVFSQFISCNRVNPDGNPATNDCEVDMVDDRFIQIGLLRP